MEALVSTRSASGPPTRRWASAGGVTARTFATRSWAAVDLAVRPVEITIRWACGRPRVVGSSEAAEGIPSR